MNIEEDMNPEEQIIKDEIYKAMDQERGLTLLPFLTGTGKSYSVKEYIAEKLCAIYKDQQEGKTGVPRRIIYTAPNKNNLITPEELKTAMKQKMPQEGNESIAAFIKEEVVFMKNNLDSIIDGLKSLGENWDERGKTFRKWFRELEELTKKEANYEDFTRCYKVISKYAMKKKDTLKMGSGNLSAMDNELIELLKENAEDAERELRRKIRSLWVGAKPRDKDSNKTLMQKNKIQGKLLTIVIQLFPNYGFEDKTVLIMTVSKFINPIDRILKKSIILYDKLTTRKTTIVMDEIDSAYATILDNYLSEGAMHGYELSQLLSEIILHYSCRTESSKIAQAEKEAFPDESNICRLKNIHTAGMKLHDMYHLGENYVAADDEDAEKYLKAILNDGTLTTLCENSNGKKKKRYILCRYSKKERKVIMSISDDDKQTEKTDCFNLEDMITDGLNLIRRMGIYLNRVTYAYVQLSKTKWKKANSQSEDIDSADALENIMDALMLNDDDRKYFRSYCLALRTYQISNTNTKDKGKYIEQDNSYFAKGIHLLTLENSNGWQIEKTDIRVYAASNTPEGLLVHMAQNSNVVGLSATGFNASVSDNFYLPYIKEQLKADFREISPECIEQLRAFSKVKWRNYLGDEPKATVECMKLPSNTMKDTFPKDQLPLVILKGNSSEGLLQTKFCKAGAEKEYKCLRDFLKDTMETFGKQDYYIWNRYWGLFLALYDFYSNPSLHAMLVLETKIPKDGNITSSNIDYSSKIIERAIRIICGSLRIDFDSTSLYIAKASNFDEIRKEVIEQWKKGEKAILFSAYATTSKGTNLPIPITDRNRGQAQITILPEYYDPNNHKYQSMDIDCLYLGRLTHLVKEIPINGERNIRTKALLACLTEGTKLWTIGQISYYDKAGYCYNLLKAYQNHDTIMVPQKIRNTPGIHNLINKVLAQSLGRIDRTYKKSRLTKIYIEESNLTQIDYGELTQQRLTNPLLDMLTLKAGIVQSDTYEQRQLEEKERRDANLVQSNHQNSLWHFKRLFTYCHDPRPEVRKKSILHYHRVRDFILHYPVATDAEIAENPDMKYYYTPFSSERDGYVIQRRQSKVNGSEDTDDWTIEYIPPGGTLKDGNPTRYIDEQHTILSVIRKNQWLSQQFEEEGIPLTWPKGKWLLTPKAFDLYRGILAEKAFEIIMNARIAQRCKDLGLAPIPIREMDEEVFEVCDFYFPGCYIDVKDWRYGINKSEKEFREECEKKRELCNEHYHDNGKIVIVNIYPNDASIDNRNMFQNRHYLEIRRLLQPDGSLNKKASYLIDQLIMKGIEIHRKGEQDYDRKNNNNSQN